MEAGSPGSEAEGFVTTAGAVSVTCGGLVAVEVSVGVLRTSTYNDAREHGYSLQDCSVAPQQNLTAVSIRSCPFATLSVG